MNVYPLRSKKFQSSGEQHSAELSRLHFHLRVQRIPLGQKIFQRKLFFNLILDFDKKQSFGKVFSSSLTKLNSMYPQDFLKNKNLKKRWFFCSWLTKKFWEFGKGFLWGSQKSSQVVQWIICGNEIFFQLLW